MRNNFINGLIVIASIIIVWSTLFISQTYYDKNDLKQTYHGYPITFMKADLSRYDPPFPWTTNTIGTWGENSAIISWPAFILSWALVALTLKTIIFLYMVMFYKHRRKTTFGLDPYITTGLLMILTFTIYVDNFLLVIKYALPFLAYPLITGLFSIAFAFVKKDRLIKILAIVFYSTIMILQILSLFFWFNGLSVKVEYDWQYGGNIWYSIPHIAILLTSLWSIYSIVKIQAKKSIERIEAGYLLLIIGLLIFIVLVKILFFAPKVLTPPGPVMFPEYQDSNSGNNINVITP